MRISASFVALVALCCVAASLADATALDDYVNAPDPVYNYTYSGVMREGNGWRAYMYLMTSQSWMTEKESDRPVWQHQMAVVIPHEINKSLDSAIIYITGGGNYGMNDFPHADDEGLMLAGALAVHAKSPSAVLWQVPNQPIKFPCDPIYNPPESRTEDQVIALTFWHYVVKNASKPEFIAYFPMVKAAIRALDTLEAVVPLHSPNKPKRFFVAGASKRGWTTWLVGAVAPQRVAGLIPIVLSAVNVRAFVHRQFQFYGAWTFALTNYWHLNFTQDIDTANSYKLWQLVDPWYYRDRLTMPKVTVNAVGDEFQMPDDQRYWAHDMPGEMNLLLVQNAEHSEATGVLEIVESLSAFATAVQAGYPRPNYTWHIDEATGNITLYTPVTPKKVRVWSASSGEGVSAGRRDFRWAAINATPCLKKVFGACFRPILWVESDPLEVAPNTFMAAFDPPSVGWTGFLIEVTWHNPVGPKDFVFTSPASVVPNTLPFPPCTGATCRGTLC
jgi:PhoPQ-activated pathogenicity-related protein